jgi:hypothetical protein
MTIKYTALFAHDSIHLVVWSENQPAGLTSILSLTATPGFALFASSMAFSRAARERTVPDSVISFLGISVHANVGFF